MPLIPSVRPTLTVGGRVYVDLTNLIVLHGSVGTTNNASSMRRQFGTSGYLPSGSKTFQSWSVAWRSTVAAAVRLIFFYSDNDLGMDTNTAVTNQKYVFGGTSGGDHMNDATYAGRDYEGALVATIPNGKYTGVSVNGTGINSVTLYGYEV